MFSKEELMSITSDEMRKLTIYNAPTDKMVNAVNWAMVFVDM